MTNPANDFATIEQLTQIRRRAVNDTTREIMANGVRLSHDQADELGEEALSWIGGRLGLNVEVTAEGVNFTSPKHYSGDATRRAGIQTNEES